jgi:hypothetical protein
MDALSIYRVLVSQDFDDWYENIFDDHVKGDEGAPDQVEIINDIAQMFGVEYDSRLK